MSPDHWSKLTWDTVSAGGYELFDPIGYLDRKRDRAYKQRVIVTPLAKRMASPYAACRFATCIFPNLKKIFLAPLSQIRATPLQYNLISNRILLQYKLFTQL